MRCNHRLGNFLFLAVIIFFPLNLWAQDWNGFQADLGRSGNSSVDFYSKDIAGLWVFNPSGHVWSYNRGSSVWSSSAAIGRVGDKPLVFLGLYNRNLYALNALTGEVAWRFTTGGALNSAPFFAEVNSRPIVYIISGDRTAYALDARTGEKIWSYETLGWSYTVQEAVTSSPLVVSIDNRPRLIFCIWNNTTTPLNSLKQGEIYALDAVSGKKIYSLFLSASPLNSPAFAYANKRPMIFVSSSDGRVFGIDAREGAVVWEVTLGSGIYSSPSVNTEKEKSQVFLGSRFGNLYALDAATGRVIWDKKFGYFIDSTPAVLRIKDKAFIYFGAYDRNIYCLDAEDGQEIWRFKTGDYVTSSCALAKIGDSAVIFAQSLDNNLYCLDAAKGSLLWSRNTGSLIWKYHTRGDTHWSSLAVSSFSGKPLLVFPAYDGKVYAFSVRKFQTE
jgi:outer membrane protein assembly factor BamB